VPTIYFGILSGVVMLIAMVAELTLTPLIAYAMPLGRRLKFGQAPTPMPAVAAGSEPGAE
jgi:hypothetical protein